MNTEALVQELLGLTGQTEGANQWHTPKGPLYSHVGNQAEARANLLLLHLGGYLKETTH